MRTLATLLERLFFARNFLERQLGQKVTTGQLGQLMAERLGRQPFSASSVSQWMSGKQGMSLEAVRALAELCGLDPGWLAFGEASAAPEPERATGTAALLALVRTQYELWNRRAFDQCVAAVTEGAERVIVPFGQSFLGRDGFRQSYERWATAFPDGRIEATNVIPCNAWTVAECSGRGTHQGPLDSSAGEIGPTGKWVDMPFCEVFRIQGDKIAGARVYFDGATFMRQLGLSRLTVARRPARTRSKPSQCS